MPDMRQLSSENEGLRVGGDQGPVADKAKITEIFQSVQGEGRYVGVKQVFIRFFGCNMRCEWCDTPQATGSEGSAYDEYTTDELMRKISDLWSSCHSVSFTGGEPLVQSDFIRAFLPRLKSAWVTTYLETNGILYRELGSVIGDIDIVSMDLKLPSSTKCRPFWEEHAEFLEVAKEKDVFTKAVITCDTTREDVRRAVKLVAGIDDGITLILQPNYFDHEKGVIQKCLEFQEECSEHLKNVRVVPQMHKFLKLR